MEFGMNLLTAVLVAVGVAVLTAYSIFLFVRKGATPPSLDGEDGKNKKAKRGKRRAPKSDLPPERFNAYWWMAFSVLLPIAALAAIWWHFGDSDRMEFYYALGIYLVVFGSSLRIVPQRTVRVVEIFGVVYFNTLPTGPHLILPFLMRVREDFYIGDDALSFKAGVRDENDTTKPFRSSIDVKNDSVIVLSRVLIRVAYNRDKNSAYEAAYNVRIEGGYKQAVLSLIEASLRAAFGKMDLDGAIASKNQVQNAIFEDEGIRQQFEEWGVDFLGFYIEDIDLSEDSIKNRRRRLTARVDRDSAILRGEGEGGRLAKIRDGSGLTPEQAAMVDLNTRQFEVFRSGNASIFIQSGGGDAGINIPFATVQAREAFQKAGRAKKGGEDTTSGPAPSEPENGKEE